MSASANPSFYAIGLRMAYPNGGESALSLAPSAALIAEGHLRVLIQHQRPHKGERSSRARHFHRHRQYASDPLLQVENVGGNILLRNRRSRGQIAVHLTGHGQIRCMQRSAED